MPRESAGTDDTTGCCELCGRGPVRITRHHLIPRSQHDKRYARLHYAREEMLNRIAWLCPACHTFLHAVFSERELGSEWNRLDTLRQHPEVRDFVHWLATKPPSFMPKVRRMKRPRRQ